MKAAIKNPYLDTLGGGERYTIGVIKTLLGLGYKVDMEWEAPSIVAKLEQRFGTKLDGLEIVKDINRGDGYDVCFWVSDGSIPTLRSRKNILHFQVPFHHIGGNNLLNKMKLFRVDHIICNSEFTKKIIDQEYGVESIVIYPPVDTKLFKAKRKEKTILFIGRFSELLQSKGQEVLISEFKKLFDSGYEDWSLILAGGAEVGAKEKLEELRKRIGEYPIKIIDSPTLSEVKELYGKAKIFWSATGFGTDADKDPKSMEHFGMTLVEAMSAGCCCLAFNGGGYREIITNERDGYLWETTMDLVRLTKKIIDNTKISFAMSKEAKISAEKFSYERFKEKFRILI